MFSEITKLDDISLNPFKMTGKDWMLVTAAKEGKVNTMTASWGGMGVLWKQDVAFVFIRPQRYTKEFVDTAERLSLSFPSDKYRKALGYLGTVSGRDEDKIAKSGLTVVFDKENGVPYFQEAEIVLFLRKLYVQSLDENCFLDKDIIPECYAGKDFHIVYVCAIEKALRSDKSE